MKIYIFFAFTFLLIGISCKQNNEKDSGIRKKSDLNNMSIAEITKLIRKEPQNASLYDLRSNLYLKKGVVDSAIHNLELAIAIDSFESSYYLKLSELYLRDKGQSEKTKELLEKCLRLFPKNVQANLYLANLHLYVRQYDKALKLLDRVRELDPYNPHQFFTKGIIFLEMGDTAKALANFQSTVEVEASYFEAHMELGRIFSYLGDSVAIQYYKNAINLVPESIDAHYSMAMFLQESGDFKRALDTYNKLIDIDSLFFPAYHNIGYMYMYKKEFTKGIGFFNKAIDINPKYVQAYLHRGVCFEELKNYYQAKADFSYCLVLVENYELALQGLNRLDKIKTN